MGDVGVELGPAFRIARPSGLRESRAALVAILRPQMVLRAALGQWAVSLRLGMATKGPLVPSMIFRSRTTKQLSNVIEQKALQPLAGVLHELDADLGDFHGTPSRWLGSRVWRHDASSRDYYHGLLVGRSLQSSFTSLIACDPKFAASAERANSPESLAYAGSRCGPPAVLLVAANTVPMSRARKRAAIRRACRADGQSPK